MKAQEKWLEWVETKQRLAEHKQRKMIFNQKTLSDTVIWVYVAANLIQFEARRKNKNKKEQEVIIYENP